jgi:hypothetical protein
MSTRFVNVEERSVSGHVISWAGDCPWTNSICFGTNEGCLIILPDLLPEASLNSGAINAIAFSGDLVTLSSPSEVTLCKRISEEPLLLQKLAHSFEGGAHSIVAAAPGVFLATLGDDGVLCLSVDAKGNVTARVARQASGSEYYYKIVPFIDRPGREVFLCAARHDGILVITTENGIPRPPVTCFRFGEQDIIDVCPLNHPDYPYAVTCLSRSCGLFIVPDVFSTEFPYEVRFADIRGTAYSLAAAQDHLFLLTSEAFFCLPRVISRMLKQAPLNSIPSPVLPMSASEMYLLGDHSIVLLADGGAKLMTVAELVGETLADGPAVVSSGNRQVSMEIPNRQLTRSRFQWQNSTLDLTLDDPLLV